MINNDLQKILKLNEFQKKKIKKNLSYDFFYELDKMTDSKEFFFKLFSKKIEILSKTFDYMGIMFYGINFEFISKDNSFEEVYKEVEEILNYIGYNVELVEFCYISIEIKERDPSWSRLNKINNNKEKMTFLIKGLFSVRSILGKNNLLLLEFKELFSFSFYEIDVIWLQNASFIVKYWTNLINQKNFKFHRFVNYSNLYAEFYGSIADDELKFEDRCAFGQENLFISSTMNIKGIEKKTPSNVELIVYLLKLFMDLHQLRLYKNKIYSKVIGSQISWHVVFDLDEIKKKFILNFDSLKLKYSQQLKYINFNDLFLKDLDSTFIRIKSNNILLHDESFFNEIVEFKDGVFFFEDNKFLEFNCIADLLNLKTNIYINCSYYDLNSGSFWLFFLKKKFSKLEFELFFSDFKIK